MTRRMCLAVTLTLLVACEGSPAPAPTPALAPRVADAALVADAAVAVDAEVDAGVRPHVVPTGCIADANAQRTCEAKGARFLYGPPRIRYCGGMAPPADYTQRMTKQNRVRPCLCIDTTEQAKPCPKYP